MNIVLFEPDIPNNVGAIGRIASVTGAKLHLIRPYGFILNEKHMKKAGLDYWSDVTVYEYNNFEKFLEDKNKEDIFLCSTKGKYRYDKIQYPPKAYFVFGRESKGLPKELLQSFLEQSITIPMRKDKRSLNISVSVGVIVYEALKQREFDQFI